MGLAGSAANALPFFGANTLSIKPGMLDVGILVCANDTTLSGGTCFSTTMTPTTFSGSYFFVGGGTLGTTFIEGFNGITLGVGQPAGSGSHFGAPNATDTGAITKPWNFFMNTGHDFAVGTGINTSAATSDPNSLDLSASGQTLALPHPNVDGHHFLDFSNWRVTWNAIPSTNMGGGLQDCGTSTDGICVDAGDNDIDGTFFNGSSLAHVECFTDSAHTVPQTSCSASSFYVAEYAAVWPQADPSGFGGVLYELNLEGQVSSAVPVPSAAFLFGSGLLGLIGIAKKRKAT